MHFGKKKKDPQVSLLDVRISKATATLWQGKARSISTKNLEGPLDVLPMHANFITLLKNVPIHITLPEGEVKRFTFPLAVMSVRDNVVRVYTEITARGA
jgi:F0F1-type ATP synthase epsilon subunit